MVKQILSLLTISALILICFIQFDTNKKLRETNEYLKKTEQILKARNQTDRTSSTANMVLFDTVTGRLSKY